MDFRVMMADRGSMPNGYGDTSPTTRKPDIFHPKCRACRGDGAFSHAECAQSTRSSLLLSNAFGKSLLAAFVSAFYNSHASSSTSRSRGRRGAHASCVLLSASCRKFSKVGGPRPGQPNRDCQFDLFLGPPREASSSSAFIHVHLRFISLSRQINYAKRRFDLRFA